MPDTHTRTQHGLAQCPMCAYKYRDPIRDDLLAALEAIIDHECGNPQRCGVGGVNCAKREQAIAAIAKARGEDA